MNDDWLLTGLVHILFLILLLMATNLSFLFNLYSVYSEYKYRVKQKHEHTNVSVHTRILLVSSVALTFHLLKAFSRWS